LDGVDIAYAGVVGQAELIRSGQITSVQLTRLVLDRIERANPLLNAFRIVMRNEALAEAAARDAQTDPRGPLHGVPIAIKDELDVAGQLTAYGTAARDATAVAVADCESVRRLRAAGAVIVGKTNMPEFGAFPFTESSAYGITRNPWDVGHTPGGSSGGTAAAVAAGLVAAGMAGDSGGSIRIPAACCGLFGLKPSRGLVPTDPYEHLWFDLGTLGALTRTVADSALLYDVLTSGGNSYAAAAAREPSALRIAVSGRPSQLGVRLHQEQNVALQATADTLRGIGHEVTSTDPSYPVHLSAAFVPQLYSGVRTEAALVEHPELLERRTRQGLAIANAFPRPLVALARRHGERIARRLNGIFDRYDVLLTPTIAPLPRAIGVLDGVSNIRAGLRSMPYIAYTAVWNVTGSPAASVPAGTASSGLPLAVQIVAAPGCERTLLSLARQLERVRPWAERRPPEL
jgi:amidase